MFPHPGWCVWEVDHMLGMPMPHVSLYFPSVRASRHMYILYLWLRIVAISLCIYMSIVYRHIITNIVYGMTFWIIAVLFPSPRRNVFLIHSCTVHFGSIAKETTCFSHVPRFPLFLISMFCRLSQESPTKKQPVADATEDPTEDPAKCLHGHEFNDEGATAGGRRYVWSKFGSLVISCPSLANLVKFMQNKMQGPNEKSVLNGHGPSSFFLCDFFRFPEVHFY